MLYVIYINALGNLARASFHDIKAARTYAIEHAQSIVMRGDPVMDHYAGPAL